MFKLNRLSPVQALLLIRSVVERTPAHHVRTHQWYVAPSALNDALDRSGGCAIGLTTAAPEGKLLGLSFTHPHKSSPLPAYKRRFLGLYYKPTLEGFHAAAKAIGLSPRETRALFSCRYMANADDTTEILLLKINPDINDKDYLLTRIDWKLKELNHVSPSQKADHRAWAAAKTDAIINPAFAAALASIDKTIEEHENDTIDA